MPPRIQPDNPRPQPDLQQIQDAIETLTTTFTDLRQSQDQRNKNYILSIQALQTQITDLQNNQQSNIHSPSVTSSHNSNVATFKPPKLNLPPFDGSNPLEWLFQADHFFTHFSINPTLRLNYIPIYMSGDALAWFQWLFNNKLITTWERFTRDLEIRFGPSTFENHQQALFKLKQTTSVHDYQKEFERLCNRVTNLPKSAILDCFISGLKPEFQHDMAILQPTSISQVIGLAKLIESKITASKPYSNFHKQQPRQITTPTSSNPLLPTPPQQLALPPPQNYKPALPICRLTPTELQNRRARGLCFNCDEHFIPGHRCKPTQFLLLLTNEEDNSIETTPQNPEELMVVDDPINITASTKNTTNIMNTTKPPLTSSL